MTGRSAPCPDDSCRDTSRESSVLPSPAGPPAWRAGPPPREGWRPGRRASGARLHRTSSWPHALLAWCGSAAPPPGPPGRTKPSRALSTSWSDAPGRGAGPAPAQSSTASAARTARRSRRRVVEQQSCRGAEPELGEHDEQRLASQRLGVSRGVEGRTASPSRGDGRPGPEGHRSVSNSFETSRCRCSARNADTLPGAQQLPRQRPRVQRLRLILPAALQPHRPGPSKPGRALSTSP